MIYLNKKTHSYLDDNGNEYLSVTKFLGTIFPFDRNEIANKCINMPASKYYKWSLNDVFKEWQSTALKGNSLHHACEMFIKHKEYPKDKKLFPILEQFSKLRWKGNLLSEVIIWDKEYLLAGTADLIEDCGDYAWLWDIKTCNSIDDEKLIKYSWQLEIYKRLATICLNKPIKIGGIIWFDNFFKNSDKTKLKVLKTLECKTDVDKALMQRKQLL